MTTLAVETRGPSQPTVALSIRKSDSLQDYIAHFAGYGDLRAPLWFVGMEEGGGRSIAELTTRVETWSARGRQPLEDLASYHRAIGMPSYFEPPFQPQPTWRSLVRALQAWRGAATDHATLRQVQATELGAHGGAAALLELMPLPARNRNEWPYAPLAPAIPALADRTTYRTTYEPARITMLHGLIQSAAPRAIVCYGSTYRKAWSTLAGQALRPITVAERTCYVSERTVPLFVSVPHPVAHGMTSRFWEDLGTKLRDLTT